MPDATNKHSMQHKSIANEGSIYYTHMKRTNHLLSSTIHTQDTSNGNLRRLSSSSMLCSGKSSLRQIFSGPPTNTARVL